MQQPTLNDELDEGNARTVFVVQSVNRDFTDARRFGRLQAVFGNVRKPYDTDALIGRARRVFRSYQPGDHLLMVGDPALCAVAMSVLCENQDTVKVLSWDNNTFTYTSTEWCFDPESTRPYVDDGEDL